MSHGFDNDVVYGSNVDFRGASPVVGQFTTDGQMLFGATAAPYARVALPTSTPEIAYVGSAGGGTWTSKLNGGSVTGAKFTLSGGTFSITPNDAGSMTFVVPSNVTPGNFVRVNTSTPSTFVDASGTSTIAGALFGFQTTDAMEAGKPFPYFIYAALDNTDSNLAFFLTALPNRNTIGGNAVGKQGSAATADVTASFFALGNPTVANYANSRLTYVGKIRMLKSNNDWTVQTLNANDGVGIFYDNAYEVSQGMLGAAAGSYFTNNAGTAPACASNNHVQWSFCGTNSILVSYNILITGNGVGAVQAQIVMPMQGGSGNPPILTGWRNRGGTITPLMAIGQTGVAHTFTMGLFDASGVAILNTGVQTNDTIQLGGCYVLGGT